MASLVAQRLKCLPAMWETRFNPWVGKIPWRRKWQPTSVFLPGESHGRRSLVGYSPQGCKELDTTEWLHFHFHFKPIAAITRFLVYITLEAKIIQFTEVTTQSALPIFFRPYIFNCKCIHVHILKICPVRSQMHTENASMWSSRYGCLCRIEIVLVSEQRCWIGDSPIKDSLETHLMVVVFVCVQQTCMCVLHVLWQTNVASLRCSQDCSKTKGRRGTQAVM